MNEHDAAVLCAALQKYDTPTVSNAIEAFGIREAIVGFASADVACQFPDLGPMAGYAVTCTFDSTTSGAMPDSRLFDLIEAIVRAPKPAVVVCQYVGDDLLRGCFLGDVSATLYKRVGAIGVVTDAPNRDLGTVQARAPGFHVFGRGSVASHGRHVVMDVDIPVVIGGLRVNPGDLLHGDRNGLIQVPLQIAERIADEAEAIWLRERVVFDLMGDPSVTIDVIRRELGY